MTKKLWLVAAKNAGGVAVYVAIVSLVLNNGEKIFGRLSESKVEFMAPIAFLLIFIISALITSYLVLGKPIMMYIDGEKKNAIRLLFYTAACLAIILGLVFMAGALIIS